MRARKLYKVRLFTIKLVGASLVEKHASLDLNKTSKSMQGALALVRPGEQFELHTRILVMELYAYKLRNGRHTLQRRSRKASMWELYDPVKHKDWEDELAALRMEFALDGSRTNLDSSVF